MQISDFLREVVNKSKSGEAGERSYYGIFERFLQEYRTGTEVIIESRKSKVGIPDFLVETRKQELIGYVEAKDLGRDLDQLNKLEKLQIEKYSEEYPKLLVTNFIEFRLYENGQLVDKALLTQPAMIKLGESVVHDESSLRVVLDRFYGTTIARVISAKQLASLLAHRARTLRGLIFEEINLEDDETTMTEELLKVIRAALKPEMKPEEFADIYAQTITFGLFTARVSAKSSDFSRRNIHEYIPKTIQLLRDLFKVLSMEEMSQHIRWQMNQIIEILAKTDVDTIAGDFFSHGKTRDPIVHFYETFLKEYDPKQKERLGVYYTPDEVVGFITRSIQHLLKNNFSKKLGFADQSVVLLDPAAGTLTFPVQAINLAHQSLEQYDGGGGWKTLIREHILKNYYAFEYLMAPYTVAHLKVALALKDTGYELGDKDRFQLYLTNTLDMDEVHLQRLPLAEAITEESEAASKIKREQKILVIMGNPPYSGVSENKGKWITNLIEDYKIVDGKPLGERKHWLQDDYVKFFRFAQWKLEQNETGILGFITNHAWLDNPTFRGMRASLLKTFDILYILNLHGSTLKREVGPGGEKDENVFDIQPGVAITIGVKTGKGEKQVYYLDQWGLREKKYKFLEENDISTVKWKELKPTSEMYWMIPRDERNLKTWEKFIPLIKTFKFYSTGIVTARDELVIGYDKEQLRAKVLGFIDPNKNTDETKEYLRSILGRKEINDVENYAWSTESAKRELQKLTDLEKYFQKILYRPFDERWIFYHPAVVWRTRYDVMNFMNDRNNVGLMYMRQVSLEGDYSHVLVSDCIIDNRSFLSAKGTVQFSPLYLDSGYGQGNLLAKEDGKINLNTKFIPINIQHEDPKEIFYYMYAILYSQIYRKKYKEFLKSEFPRIPFTNDLEMFRKIAELGEMLVQLHLMKDPQLENVGHKFMGSGDGLVKLRMFDEKTERIYINNIQYFENIKLEIWKYQIGGYQVLDKWLKDRKNKFLNSEEIKHYRKVITVLEKTLEIQRRVDEIYPEVEESL